MEDGDLIYVDYDLWVMPDNEDEEATLFDTTDEERAKEEEIFDEDADYGPKAVEIGGEELFEGFSEALKEAEVGEEESVEVPPEKGIGQRDPDEIELYSRREVERKGVDPVAGKEVEIDNRRGRIIRATAGRVRIDFNHPLAGKTLKYDFEVTEKPEGPEELSRAILAKDYRAGDFTIEVSDDEDQVDIILPEQSKYDQQWFVSKLRIISDLRKHLDAKKIRLIEEYVQEEEAEEAEEENEEEPEENEGSDEEEEETEEE